MAADIRGYTKEWIQFLKNNRIVSGASDPLTGKLQYRRKVTANDLAHFLDIKTNFTEEQIAAAIHSVISKKTANQPKKRQLSQTPDAIRKRKQRAAAAQLKTQQPAAPQTQPAAPTDERKPKLHTKLKTPGAPGQKPHLTYKGLREDIEDSPSPELDEKDVEAVFALLQSQAPVDDISQPVKPVEQDPQVKKKADFEKLKNLISTTMTSDQRRELWKALNESINESYIDRDDVSDMFKDAVKMRAGSALRKNKIDISDLHKAWKDAGYPDDTDKVGYILHSHGFSEKEINKIFDDVLGSVNGSDMQDSNETIQKIIKYIKDHGLRDEIVEYMQKEFGEELTKEPEQKKGVFGRAVDFGRNLFKRKATTEDIRKIFSAILSEERSLRYALIQEQDKKSLGRMRK